MRYPEREQSAQLFEEAKTYFPGGVNSPVRAFKSVDGPPLFIKKGTGAKIFCEDNNEYIDFCGSWGPLILGHDHPIVRRAIIEAVSNGTSFGAPTRKGNLLGSLIVDNHRYLDQIRFVSSGTEAVMSAIRLARGYTGKNKILKFEGCYHGHVDSLLVKAGSGLATFGVSSSAGIPQGFIEETLVLPLDREDLVAEYMKNDNDIAAIIIEPIPANNGLLLQRPAYLSTLRNLCSEHNCLLIFDEVISGFRVGFEGAAGLYGIKPDLLTFGKIIGGGLPVGAFGGRREIMQHISPEGDVYQAGTLSANPVAMAAGFATLSHLLKDTFYTTLESKTTLFVENVRTGIGQNKLPMQIIQQGSIFWLNLSLDEVRRADQIDGEGMEKFKKLHHFLLKNGVYLGPSGYEVGFISEAHDEETLQQASKVIVQGLSYAFNVNT